MIEPPGDPENRTILGDTILIVGVRMAVLGLLAYWTFVLIQPFLTIIIWSIVFSVALYPLFASLSSLLRGRRKLAAATITLITLVIIFGPATWLGLSLADNVRLLIERFGDGSLTIPPPPDAVKNWPLIGQRAYETWQLASTNLKVLIADVAPYLKPLGGRLLGIAGSFGINLVKFVIAAIVAGFLFIPGRNLAISSAHILDRITSRHGKEFVEIAGATIRNVSRGVIGVALVQSLLAGIGLLFFGVPGAGLISFLVLVFGIIQIGPSVVLIPAIIWFWFARDVTTALFFTLYMLPVNLLDNILRPLVMAHGLNTPMMVIFIGVIGGTIAHGLIGLFIGPVVLAIAWQLVALWTREEPSSS